MIVSRCAMMFFECGIGVRRVIGYEFTAIGEQKFSSSRPQKDRTVHGRAASTGLSAREWAPSPQSQPKEQQFRPCFMPSHFLPGRAWVRKPAEKGMQRRIQFVQKGYKLGIWLMQEPNWYHPPPPFQSHHLGMVYPPHIRLLGRYLK
jgi:hypothetical protein